MTYDWDLFRWYMRGPPKPRAFYYERGGYWVVRIPLPSGWWVISAERDLQDAYDYAIVQASRLNNRGAKL